MSCCGVLGKWRSEESDGTYGYRRQLSDQSLVVRDGAVELEVERDDRGRQMGEADGPAFVIGL